MIIEGNVHKFGDDINTDDIIAATYLDSQDPVFLGSKCMENIDSGFVGRVQQGDIIVAGKNFGCGSSREHAPVALKGCGIALVIASSFARIFYRNAINIGLPILVSGDVPRIENGDRLRIDITKGKIENITRNETYSCEKFPVFMQEIINLGGLLSWIKKNKERK